MMNLRLGQKVSWRLCLLSALGTEIHDHSCKILPHWCIPHDLAARFLPENVRPSRTVDKDRQSQGCCDPQDHPRSLQDKLNQDVPRTLQANAPCNRKHTTHCDRKLCTRSIKALQRPGSIKQDQGRLRLCQKYVAPGAVQGTAEKTITSCIVSQTPSRARIRRSLPAGVAGHGTDWNSRDEILEDKRKEAFLCIHTRNNLFWISGIFIVLADLCEPLFVKGSDHRIFSKGSDFCFSSR